VGNVLQSSFHLGLENKVLCRKRKIERNNFSSEIGKCKWIWDIGGKEKNFPAS